VLDEAMVFRRPDRRHLVPMMIRHAGVRGVRVAPPLRSRLQQDAHGLADQVSLGERGYGATSATSPRPLTIGRIDDAE
jgi:hypothetical protein